MTEFHGMVGRSWLKRSVKPNSSTSQLSLSKSIMVLSKSKTTTTVPAICLFVLFVEKRRDQREKSTCVCFGWRGTWEVRDIYRKQKPWNGEDAKGILFGVCCAPDNFLGVSALPCLAKWLVLFFGWGVVRRNVLILVANTTFWFGPLDSLGWSRVSIAGLF